MSLRKLPFLLLLAGISAGPAQAQLRINNRSVQAASQGVTAASFSDADAAKLAREAVEWMDKNNPVADAKDPYAQRLNKLFANHKSEDGLQLNYKVYKVTDINAFACADGSVRVFSSLMDLMTDDELLAVIGHEIGHVRNHDTRDAIKAAYMRSAAANAAASQSGAAAALTDSQLGELAEGMMNATHSRKQESEADEYGYRFLKKHSYNVMGMVTAFQKLAKLSAGSPQEGKMQKMMSSHPDSDKRAAAIEKLAKQDGLWKETAAR